VPPITDVACDYSDIQTAPYIANVDQCSTSSVRHRGKMNCGRDGDRTERRRDRRRSRLDCPHRKGEPWPLILPSC
jgi:hypothetical protein